MDPVTNALRAEAIQKIESLLSALQFVEGRGRVLGTLTAANTAVSAYAEAIRSARPPQPPHSGA